ncbi:General stress protein 13 [compost metagenome]
MSHKFVDDPRKVVNPGDHVSVKVLKVDPVKNQISLTMKMDDAVEAAPRGEKRADAPRGPRPPVGASQVKGGGTKPPMGPGSRPAHSGGGMGAGAGKPAGNPFNNPFAALLNTNTNKK